MRFDSSVPLTIRNEKGRPDMIRVAVIDRHPAMRAGLEAILDDAPGIQVVAGAGGDRHEVAHGLYRTAPDVVIVQDAPGRADGVELAREIKSFGPRPRVLVHADSPDAVQVGAAVLAEADGIIDSSGSPRELVEALRSVAAGGTAFPDLGAHERRELAERLPAEDHAILAMRLAATPQREISDTLRMDGRALRRRLTAMIGRLRAGGAATLSAAAPRPRRRPAASAAG
jgi:DNA-binding NarL/FixJ family response regulator